VNFAEPAARIEMAFSETTHSFTMMILPIVVVERVLITP
jgi:hypothetical protein